jgi:hypothetical protein
MQRYQIPTFMVPGAAEPESAWEELRQSSERIMGRSYSTRKVYSITFEHDGVEYKATVGQPRQAVEYPRTRGRRDYNRPPRRYASGNTVMAIFEGDPFLVWEVFTAERRSEWANPALVGVRAISNVVEFAQVRGG